MRSPFDYIEKYRFDNGKPFLTDIDIAELMTQYYHDRKQFEEENKEAAKEIRKQRQSTFSTTLRQV